MAPILGYWNVRGLCAPIKYLLEFAGVEYVDKQYKTSPPPTFDRAEWMADKFNLGLDFPNLPYYIDGDVKLSQSRVILGYLARKHGLDGKTEADRLRVELIVAQCFDYMMDLGRIAFNSGFLAAKADYHKGMADKLKALANFLGSRDFVAGNYVTYGDFVLFEFLEGQVCLFNDLLDHFPVLAKFRNRVRSLEAIDKYFKSGRAIKYPFFGAPAYCLGPYSDQLIKEAEK